METQYITRQNNSTKSNLNSNSESFQLSETQKLDWLQLIRSENVGPATFRDLINHFGTASHALEALPQLSSRAGKRSIKIFPRHNAEKEIENSTRLKVNIVGMGEAQYPRYLKAIEYPPPLLSVKGQLVINRHPPIALVGARNSSLSGLKLASMFAGELGAIPYHIVSGFARGIDIAAHRAAIDTGTVCVLAGGVDNIYPPQHDKFYHQILDSGNAFVSEMPLGYSPRSADFPRRNRIIAGISLGVIVIEASKRSGSLITARLANECGRLVFAVPGSPLDPRSAGANSLLKKGALMASEAADIVEEISLQLDNPLQSELFKSKKHSLEDSDSDENARSEDDNNSPADIVTDTLMANRQKIIQALGPTPVEIDEIVRYCQIPVSHVQLVLIELSLAGRLEHHAGNQVSLIMQAQN